MEVVYDIEAIMKFLPHRYPFILIDRIIKLVAGKELAALKNVTINEAYFQGHFPGIPVMPGVLIIEAMAQTGGVLFAEMQKQKKKDLIFYFMGIDKVRFRKPVVPGDRLIMEVRLLNLRSKAVKMSGTATVDQKRVAEAEFMATIGEKS